jgi:tetratricopeptide (TPR) repeat protein
MASRFFIWMTFVSFIGVASAQPPAAPPKSGAQLESELAKNPRTLTLRVEAANAYTREGKPDKVIELLNSYTDQLDATGFMTLAAAYSNKKDFVNEVRIFTILSAKEDDNFRWHMLLGQAYMKQANSSQAGERKADLFTAAIQQLRRTLQLNKKFKPAYDLLLQTFLAQKDNNEARELINEGLEKFGDRPELNRELCRLDSLDGYLVQAVKSCRHSIELSPSYPDHYVYLVQALRDQGEDNQAERTITTAAQRFAQSEFVQWAAGKVYFLKKNYPVATRYFEAAVKANGKEGRSHFGLAQSLFESGRESEALPHFVVACKSDPSTVETFLTAGSRLKQKGNMDLGSKFISAANNCH